MTKVDKNTKLANPRAFSSKNASRSPRMLDFVLLCGMLREVAVSALRQLSHYAVCFVRSLASLIIRLPQRISQSVACYFAGRATTTANPFGAYKFLRTVSAAVLVCFTSVTFSPAMAAIRAENAKNIGASAAADPMGAALLALEDSLKQVAPSAFPQPQSAQAKRAQAGRKSSVAVLESTISPSQLLDTADGIIEASANIDKLADTVEDEFTQTGKRLVAQNLPPVILERHREAVATFNARRAELKSLTHKIQDARPARSLTALGKRTATPENTASLQTAINELGRFMAAYPNQRAHSQTDPYNLPFRIASDKVRQAAQTEAELNAVLSRTADAASSTIAATKTTATKSTSLTAGPDAADLAETEDAQLTPAIRAKAAELNNHPLTIYNWVRNHIEYLPTYGSIQGSDLTLLSKRGNAFDTASLLIALYRAANIPARYVYGTVEISAEQAMNWVGGVTNADAAASLLSQGGIPTTSIVSGGKIVKFRIETVWVEAWLNYYPSRGAKHTPYASLTDAQAKGNQWVPMDASFKQYTYTNGLDIKANVPFNAQTFLDQSKVGATINESEGWVQNLNQANIQSQLTAYQNQVKAYVDAQRPNATVGDVIGNKVIVAATPPILAGTLPYTLKATANRYPALPDTLRHKIEFKFYASESAQQLDSPAFVVSRGLPSVANKRVSLTYDPATAADAKIISDAADSYQTSFAAYLVQVTPRLKIETQTLASGPSISVGNRQYLTLNVIAPWYNQARDYNLTSGDLSVFGINLAGTTYDQWNSRMISNSLSTGDHPEFTAEMFHQIVLSWWGQKFAFNEVIGATSQVRSYQLPSHALVGAPVSITYSFGVPKTATYQSRVMDAKMDFVIATHLQNDQEKRRLYALTIGQVGSFLEAGIFEQAFLLKQGYAMSAMTALKAAADLGIRTYTITSANLNTVLESMQTSSNTKRDIQNAVNAGKRVTASQNDIVVASFKGIGYIVEDPDTGSAAYIISGGRMGGDAPAGANVYPLPQVLATPILGLLVGSSLRSIGAGVVATGGIATGIAVPALIGTCFATIVCGGAVILAALVPTLIIYSSQARAIEDRYPRTSRIFRHYTRALVAPLIDASKLIFGSAAGGTFNPNRRAVYVEEPIDATIACPPTGDQSARKTLEYALPLFPAETPLTRANAYVEFEITRAGYWEPLIRKEFNGRVTETIFDVPFIYFGPYAIAIAPVRSCY
jgi:transglutaminase-like putative cysteine protease